MDGFCLFDLSNGLETVFFSSLISRWVCCGRADLDAWSPSKRRAGRLFFCSTGRVLLANDIHHGALGDRRCDD
jgi:hypothetical protein